MSQMMHIYHMNDLPSVLGRCAALRLRESAHEFVQPRVSACLHVCAHAACM